jgi:CBS domain-containing protein
MSIEKLIRRATEALPPKASCAAAARLMREAGVGSVIVSQDDRPLGIVTDRDLVTRVMAEGRDPRAVELHEIMSPNPVFVARSRDPQHVLELMRDLSIRRVPVVNEEQRLVGVVSLDDLIISLGDQLANVAETIRKEM